MSMLREIDYCAVECERRDAPYVVFKTGQSTEQHRWSIFGWEPWLMWAPRGRKDPLGELDNILEQCANLQEQVCAALGDLRLPVPVLMGALSYDLGRTIEDVEASATDPWNDLQAVLYGFRQFIITDEVERKSWSVDLNDCKTLRPRRTDDYPAGGAGNRTDAFAYCAKAECRFDVTGPAVQQIVRREPMFCSNFEHAGYEAAVSQIREMTSAGDCYQVNLSQQFTAPCDKPAQQLLQDALALNPAAMMGVVDTGSLQIVSTSPETLLQKRGDRLMTRPIKGTRPHVEDTEQDAALIAELQASEKERAELNMIIDLARNDLGRVSVPGSVQVESAGDIESFSNVHHRVATVSSRVRPEASWSEVLRAVFPGASITGCPKPQAMQVIEQLEGVRRGFYCGSLGYIDCWGDGHWNIAIRTITLANGQATFNLGGGIVFDSDPAAEYQETLDKGRTLFQLLRSS